MEGLRTWLKNCVLALLNGIENFTCKLGKINADPEG